MKVARYLGIARTRLTDFGDAYDEEASQRLLDLKEEEIGEATTARRVASGSRKKASKSAGTAAEAGAGSVADAGDDMRALVRDGTPDRRV